MPDPIMMMRGVVMVAYPLISDHLENNPSIPLGLINV
jgi:hypothetical protein